MPVNRSALAALATTLLLWASAFVAIRHLGETVSPVGISLVRQLVAAAALGAVAFARGFRLPARRDWPTVVAIGVLWFAVYHVALNAAEVRVDAGTAAMLIQFSPVMITVLAAVFLKEPVGPRFAVGVLVALVGVTLIAYSTQQAAQRDILGVVLCLVAAAAYSVSVILQKPLLTRVTALDVTFLASVVGAVAVLPFAADVPSELADAGAADLWWLVYLGLLPTAVAFTTWAYALSHLPANLMGVSTYLVPPITVAIAWVVLSETPPPLAYLGGVLCLVGVWLARRSSKQQRRPREGGGERLHHENA